MTEKDAAVVTGQAAAIQHGEGPALVIAGPGSGKTYTITKRLEYLINNRHIEPSNILTITFTNAAAAEMRSRAYSLIGGNAGAVTFGTFHSVFYSILKSVFSLNASNILRPQDKYMILCQIARELDITAADMSMVYDELSGLISRSKNGMETYGGFGGDMDEKIISLYSQKLKELRLLDFDDMIIKCRSLFLKEPSILEKYRSKYRFIMADEYQDTNMIQNDTLKLLAGNTANLMTVGDDDQSIYGFRGAGPGILKQFLDDYPQAVVYELDVNYRCCAPVADAADRVIAENKDRIIKNHTSFNKTGEDVDIGCYKNRSEEIKAVIEGIDTARSGDYCILVRTNEMASYFADELERAGIPVKIKGKRKSRYDTDIGKDLVSYLRLASGIYGREDILRVMNKPMRFIAREAFGRDNAKVEDAVGYYRGSGDLYENAVRFAYDIEKIGKMSPRSAMRYLMKVVGYEKHLKSSGRDTKELCLLYDAASDYASVRQWLAAIEDEKERINTHKEAGKNDKTGVSVMTLHASKGLEFPEVYIADLNEGIIPYHRADPAGGVEEERRLLYVGMTRAIKKLHLYFIEESMGKPMFPSSFLRAFLGKNLAKRQGGMVQSIS